MAQAESHARQVIQDWLDQKAKNLGFSNGNSLILYAGFANPYQQIALEFAQNEANVWVQAGQIRDDVLAGNRPPPSDEELVDALEWGTNI